MDWSGRALSLGVGLPPADVSMADKSQQNGPSEGNLADLMASVYAINHYVHVLQSQQIGDGVLLGQMQEAEAQTLVERAGLGGSGGG